MNLLKRILNLDKVSKIDFSFEQLDSVITPQTLNDYLYPRLDTLQPYVIFQEGFLQSNGYNLFRTDFSIEPTLFDKSPWFCFFNGSREGLLYDSISQELLEWQLYSERISTVDRNNQLPHIWVPSLIQYDQIANEGRMFAGIMEYEEIKKRIMG